MRATTAATGVVWPEIDHKFNDLRPASVVSFTAAVPLHYPCEASPWLE